MRTRLYLVRHAESEDNAARRFGGRRDTQLTARGLRQAEALAERLRREPIDAVLSSSLTRAKQTAAVVASARGMGVAVAPGWEEGDFGAWEGLTYEEAFMMHPKAVRAWEASPIYVPPPGGESFAAVYRRVRAAHEAVLAAYRGASVVLFSHGGPIRAALVQAMRAPLSVALHLTVDPCALTMIDDYESSQVVVTVNEPDWQSEG